MACHGIGPQLKASISVARPETAQIETTVGRIYIKERF
jgi:hypothetical protein